MTKIMENEMNMVTGGDFWETSDDSCALKHHGYMDESFSPAELMAHWIKNSAKVDQGWAKVGITCVTCPFGANRYYKDGKQISQNLAWYILYNG